MAETKKVTETKTVKSSETKAAAPKATAAKKTTTKAAAPKATATTAKKAAPKAEVKAETAAVEVAPVKATETKKTTKPAGDMLKVTLVKSGSGRLEKQTRTLEALGLRKTNSFNIVPDNAAIRGMIFVVKHLVKVEKV
jgi:large subunit ribosomal protein L30